MTSISGTGWGSGIQSLLQRQVTTGTIPSADQSALSSAIGDIGAGLQSGTATASTSMKDRVDGLIDKEVSNGKLTGDQATELKGLFDKAHGHAHHAHGGGGASALDSLFSPDDTTTGLTGATGSADPLTAVTAGARGAVDGLTSFVSSLRSAVSSNGLYGAGGSTAGRVGSLLVNAFA